MNRYSLSKLLFHFSVFLMLNSLFSLGVVCAQDTDIIFQVNNGKVELLDDILNTSFLIAPGFPPMPGPAPTQTDQPGFRAADGTLSSGAVVGLEVVQPLHYWRDDEVLNPMPLSTIFRIETGAGTLIDVDRGGIPTSSSFAFATAAEEGGVHQHILFRLPESTAPDGAYGVVVKLTADNLEDSEPFLLVFSQQISSTDLNTAANDILAASGIAADALQSDFDLNDGVDSSDLSNWSAGFGTSSHALLADGDADRDGDVDGSDFLIWQRELSPRQATSFSVPEPEAIVLLMIGILASAGSFGMRHATG